MPVGDQRAGYGTRMSSSPCRTLIQPSGWAAHARHAAAIATPYICAHKYFENYKIFVKSVFYEIRASFVGFLRTKRILKKFADSL